MRILHANYFNEKRIKWTPSYIGLPVLQPRRQGQIFYMAEVFDSILNAFSL